MYLSVERIEGSWSIEVLKGMFLALGYLDSSKDKLNRFYRKFGAKNESDDAVFVMDFLFGRKRGSKITNFSSKHTHTQTSGRKNNFLREVTKSF
jgi:hypothetical protein